MKFRAPFLLFFLIFSRFLLLSQSDQSGYKLTFHIDKGTNDTLYLMYHYQKSLFPLDSALFIPGEPLTFTGTASLPDGLYALANRNGKQFLSFIIDKNYHFQYHLDTTRNTLNFRVENSLPNTVMLAYQQKVARAQQRLQSYQHALNYFMSNSIPDSILYYRIAIYELNIEMRDYTLQMIEDHPDMLFSKMQKALLTIEIPENENITDPEELEEYQRSYYIAHFWDHFDFLDSRLIVLPAIHQRFNNYIFDYLFPLDYDTIIYHLDNLIEKTKENPQLYYYFIDRFSQDFSYNLYPNHDVVYIHLMRKYRLRHDFQWNNEDDRYNAIQKMTKFERYLIGKKSPELVMADTSGKKYFSTYHTQKEYTILWFIDPQCELCSLESEKLRSLYWEMEENGTRNFEVYSVGIDEDFDRWKSYVREKKYPWIQVGGKEANVNYIDAFNVLGNPWMVILDGDKNFILNRRIDIHQIPAYLQEYERKKGK